MTPLISEMAKIATDPELYHWFDLGAIPENGAVHIGDDELLMLPFLRTAVVGHQQDGTRLCMVLIRSEDGESVAVGGFVLDASHWKSEIEPFAYVRVEQGLQIHPLDGDDPPPKDQYMAALAVIEGFLSSLRHEQQAYTPTARKSLINSKRAAKGKGPVLFDWHTVTVAPVTAKMPHIGGTHASPRLHDRRGHWRKYPSGKVGWVKDCKVGDARKGVVFKDYKVGT